MAIYKTVLKDTPIFSTFQSFGVQIPTFSIVTDFKNAT